MVALSLLGQSVYSAQRKAPAKAPTKTPTAIRIPAKRRPVPAKAPAKIPTTTIRRLPIPAKAPAKIPTTTIRRQPIPAKAPAKTPAIEPDVEPTYYNVAAGMEAMMAVAPVDEITIRNETDNILRGKLKKDIRPYEVYFHPKPFSIPAKDMITIPISREINGYTATYQFSFDNSNTVTDPFTYKEAARDDFIINDYTVFEEDNELQIMSTEEYRNNKINDFLREQENVPELENFPPGLVPIIRSYIN
jgi:hypothetical protein